MMKNCKQHIILLDEKFENNNPKMGESTDVKCFAKLLPRGNISMEKILGSSLAKTCLASTVSSSPPLTEVFLCRLTKISQDVVSQGFARCSSRLFFIFVLISGHHLECK